MNLKKIIALFFFVLTATPRLSAQLNYVDSLKNELNTSHNDTLNLVLYSLLCLGYQNSSYDSALLYAQKQFQLAQQLDYQLDQAYALDNIGYNMYYLSSPKALQILLTGVKIAEDPGIEKNVLPEKYWNMMVYFDANSLSKLQKKPLNVRLQVLQKKSMINTH